MRRERRDDEDARDDARFRRARRWLDANARALAVVAATIAGLLAIAIASDPLEAGVAAVVVLQGVVVPLALIVLPRAAIRWAIRAMRAPRATPSGTRPASAREDGAGRALLAFFVLVGSVLAVLTTVGPHWFWIEWELRQWSALGPWLETLALEPSRYSIRPLLVGTATALAWLVLSLALVRGRRTFRARLLVASDAAALVTVMLACVGAFSEIGFDDRLAIAAPVAIAVVAVSVALARSRRASALRGAVLATAAVTVGLSVGLLVVAELVARAEAGRLRVEALATLGPFDHFVTRQQRLERDNAAARTLMDVGPALGLDFVPFGRASRDEAHGTGETDDSERGDREGRDAVITWRYETLQEGAPMPAPAAVTAWLTRREPDLRRARAAVAGESPVWRFEAQVPAELEGTQARGDLWQLHRLFLAAALLAHERGDAPAVHENLDAAWRVVDATALVPDQGLVFVLLRHTLAVMRITGVPLAPWADELDRDRWLRAELDASLAWIVSLHAWATDPESPILALGHSPTWSGPLARLHVALQMEAILESHASHADRCALPTEGQASRWNWLLPAQHDVEPESTDRVTLALLDLELTRFALSPFEREALRDGPVASRTCPRLAWRASRANGQLLITLAPAGGGEWPRDIVGRLRHAASDELRARVPLPAEDAP